MMWIIQCDWPFPLWILHGLSRRRSYSLAQQQTPLPRQRFYFFFRYIHQNDKIQPIYSDSSISKDIFDLQWYSCLWYSDIFRKDLNRTAVTPCNSLDSAPSSRRARRSSASRSSTAYRQLCGFDTVVKMYASVVNMLFSLSVYASHLYFPQRSDLFALLIEWSWLCILRLLSMVGLANVHLLALKGAC